MKAKKLKLFGLSLSQIKKTYSINYEVLSGLKKYFPAGEASVEFFLNQIMPHVKNKTIKAYYDHLKLSLIFKENEINIAKISALILCASLYNDEKIKKYAAEILKDALDNNFFKNALYNTSSPHDHLFITECFAIAQHLYPDDALKAGLLKMLSVLKWLQTPEKSLPHLIITPHMRAFEYHVSDEDRIAFLFSIFHPLTSAYKQEDSGIIIEKYDGHMILNHNNAEAKMMNSLIWRKKKAFLKSFTLSLHSPALKTHLPLHHHVYDKNNIVVFDSASALENDVLERRIILLFKDSSNILIIEMLQSQERQAYKAVLTFDALADIQKVFFDQDVDINLSQDQEYTLTGITQAGYTFLTIHIGEKYNLTFDKAQVYINNLTLDFQCIPARFID